MEIARTAQHALQVFQSDLFRDEKILWAGQPERKFFTARDFFLIPFGLFYFCFSIFWILGASGFLSHSQSLSPFGLFGIPFALIGFYLLLGGFFFKSWKQRNTYYAVTNQRILVLSTVPGRYLQAVFIESIPALNKSMNADGIGTISFGNSNPQAAMYANTGMDFLGSATGMELAPAFYDVKDANNVYDLINSQRKK
jgi:hypothetical protein